jgi:VCBS repeat-containing protein
VTFDLTKYKNSAMRLRFSFNVAKAEPWSVSSWNLDDIRVFTTNTLTANDDVYSVTKNGRLAPPAPGVLGNDRDPNNRNLIANLVSGTSHGTLTFQHNGTFVYQPEQNYLGQDSFVYELVAGTDKDTALVTINVVNPNQVPVANDLTVSTHKDTPLVRPLTGSDGDGDLLDFSIKLLPAHGTITLARDATFTYTPNPGYTGPDAFTFTVSDGKASDTGQVTISVTP